MLQGLSGVSAGHWGWCRKGSTAAVPESSAQAPLSSVPFHWQVPPQLPPQSHLGSDLEFPSILPVFCLCTVPPSVPRSPQPWVHRLGPPLGYKIFWGRGRFKSLVKMWWKRFFLALLEVGHTDMRQTHACILPSSICTEEVPLSWHGRSGRQSQSLFQEGSRGFTHIFLSCSCGSWSACAYTPTQIKGLTSATCTK